MKSICSTCKRETNHEILSEEKVYYREESGWWEENKYQIIKCKGCDTISFRKLSTDAASGGGVEYGFDPWTQELFPKRTLQSLPIKNLLNTPQNIKNIYRETIDAFNNGQFILCSGGLRAIIEGVCKQRGISRGEVDNGKGGTRVSTKLDGKIEALASNGYLTKDNANILHELRFIGNAALHELSSPSNNELKMAIEIIEHTLDNLYEFEHKAIELRKEIAKSKK